VHSNGCLKWSDVIGRWVGEGKRWLPSAESVFAGNFPEHAFWFLRFSDLHSPHAVHNAKRGNGEKDQPIERPVSRLLRQFGRGLDYIVTEVACFPRVKPFSAEF